MGTQANASMWDTLTLSQAYDAYHNGDFNSSIKYLHKVDAASLQSHLLLASSYYQQGSYQKALRLYQSIRSTSPHTKQILYYNIGNCQTKLQKYKKARKAYIKALQLGDDNDTNHNLSLIILRQEKKKSTLGIAHPKSQSSNSTQSEKDESSDKQSSSEQSSGSGAGTQKSNKNKENDKQKLTESPATQKQPLSSKVYELINKGYIHEKVPW